MQPALCLAHSDTGKETYHLNLLHKSKNAQILKQG